MNTILHVCAQYSFVVCNSGINEVVGSIKFLLPLLQLDAWCVGLSSLIVPSKCFIVSFNKKKILYYLLKRVHIIKPQKRLVTQFIKPWTKTSYLNPPNGAFNSYVCCPLVEYRLTAGDTSSRDKTGLSLWCIVTTTKKKNKIKSLRLRSSSSVIYWLPRCITVISQIKSLYQAERFDLWNIIKSSSKSNWSWRLLKAQTWNVLWKCETVCLFFVCFLSCFHASHHQGCVGALRIITHPAATPVSPKEQQQGRSARPTAH